MATTKCGGAQPLPYRSNNTGWPHGRSECPTCGGFYYVNKNGELRSHVPHKLDNLYQAQQRAALN